MSEKNVEVFRTALTALDKRDVSGAKTSVDLPGVYSVEDGKIGNESPKTFEQLASKQSCGSSGICSVPGPSGGRHGGSPHR
jgi:hypothetical protein